MRENILFFYFYSTKQNSIYIHIVVFYMVDNSGYAPKYYIRKTCHKMF